MPCHFSPLRTLTNLFVFPALQPTAFCVYIYEVLNSSDMKTISPQQEILVITGTSFSRRQWSEKNNSEPINSEREALEKACWNGLIKEMLPEIFQKTEGGEELFLWQVSEADSFIELDFSEFPGNTEKEFSINPYMFMLDKEYN